MNIVNILKVFTLGICLFCSGCYGDAMSKKNIEKVISENLEFGSSNQEIIDFFERQDWMYDFDRHLNRYQARNPEEDKLSEHLGGHQIYIYVDENKSFTKAEVEKVFNAL